MLFRKKLVLGFFGLCFLALAGILYFLLFRNAGLAFETQDGRAWLANNGGFQISGITVEADDAALDCVDSLAPGAKREVLLPPEDRVIRLLASAPFSAPASLAINPSENFAEGLSVAVDSPGQVGAGQRFKAEVRVCALTAALPEVVVSYVSSSLGLRSDNLQQAFSLSRGECKTAEFQLEALAPGTAEFGFGVDGQTAKKEVGAKVEVG